MRILITRPEPSASKTAKKLLNAGHEPVIFPMSRRKCVETAVQEDLHSANAFIFTSANALHCFKNTSAQNDLLLDTPVYAVGKTTKQSALQIGFKHVKMGTGNGEALAELIIQDIKSGNTKLSPDRSIVYLTAKERTPYLETKLAQNNIHVTPIIIYEMITDFAHKELNDILDKGEIDVVLFYSQNAVRRFFAAIVGYERKLFTSMRFGCLSNEIAAAIPDEFLNHIDIAIEPSEHHLLACIGN